MVFWQIEKLHECFDVEFVLMKGDKEVESLKVESRAYARIHNSSDLRLLDFQTFRLSDS